LASGDDTKKFTFKDGEISYEAKPTAHKAVALPLSYKGIAGLHGS